MNSEIRGNTPKEKDAMKQLRLNDWIFQKIAREKKAPHMCNDRVIAVFQETEKAYKAIVGGVGWSTVTWVPKSCVIESETTDHLDATRFCNNYDEAAAWLKDLKDYFC